MRSRCWSWRSPDERLTPHEQREKRYRAVGMFLAQQSHLLLALRDGRPTTSNAGTAAVVRMKLDGPSGIPEAALRPLDAEGGGPVYHVHTPRAGQTAHSTQEPEWLLPQEGDEALWETYAERLGLSTQVNQYARFAGIFRRARRFAEQLERDPGRHDKQHALIGLLRELGRKALMENGDWVLLLRERPIVLPKG